MSRDSTSVIEASNIFVDYIVITSPNGSNSARKADWCSLAGRNVTIWPDNDDAGKRYAADVAAMVQKVGAASVRVVQIPPRWPPCWDLADPLPPGVTEADLTELLAEAASVSNVESDAWRTPQPIASTLPPVEAFTPALLPKALRDYVMDVADRQQSPPDFVAVTAICGVAAMVGNKFRIRPKQNDDWEVVPNLWGAIVGRPSAMKSPAMQSALAPVYALQDELRRAWEEECKTLMIEAAVSNLNAKQAKKKAEKALEAGDREEAKKILANVISANEHPPCPRRSDRLAQDDALRDFPERDHAPERDEKLAGERDDHLGLACCLWPFGSAAEPLRQGAVPLEQEEPPGELDQAASDPGVARFREAFLPSLGAALVGRSREPGVASDGTPVTQIA